MVRHLVLLATALLLLPACGPRSDAASPAGLAHPAAEARIDPVALLRDLRVLTADSMEGRRTGTAGHQRAQAYLLERFRLVGLSPLGGDYRQEFMLRDRDGALVRGANLIGLVEGSGHPERYIVVSAHYDHLGIREGELYPGADDNASGTAALLAIAGEFLRERPRHSILFVATDAEEGSAHGEQGLRGAREFVADPPVPLERVLLNVNLDMVGRNDRDELYAAGTYHYPELRPFVERVAARAPVTLLMGHDRPDLPPGDDWTMLSDHGAFHGAGIPFVYFGVEDHADYHRPTDSFENIQPDFYVRAVHTVLDFLREVDAVLAGERPAPSPGR